MFRFVYEAINAINANSLNIWIPVWLRLSSALISADHKTARVSCLGPDTNKSLDVTQHPIKPSPVFTLSPRLCLLSGFSLLNLLSETGRSLTLWLPQHWSLYNGPRVAHLTARLHCLRSPHFVFIFNENWVRYRYNTVSVFHSDFLPCTMFCQSDASCSHTWPGQAHVITSHQVIWPVVTTSHVTAPEEIPAALSVWREQYLIRMSQCLGIKAPAWLPVPASRWSQIFSGLCSIYLLLNDLCWFIYFLKILIMKVKPHCLPSYLMLIILSIIVFMNLWVP